MISLAPRSRAVDAMSAAGRSGTTETATFAAGCFWGVEAAFRTVKGVLSTRVGYTGGTIDHPTYHDVCTGRTGHTEAVEIVFDPAVVTYRELLDLFWSIHDPTQLNRQGPDIGTNYRSAIFYHTSDQKRQAGESKEGLMASRRFGSRRIVTEIVPAGIFWPAEEYHQQYFEKQGRSGCHL
jgi:peptide-methionine (S)-S-oxide reductase